MKKVSYCQVPMTSPHLMFVHTGFGRVFLVQGFDQNTEQWCQGILQLLRNGKINLIDLLTD